MKNIAFFISGLILAVSSCTMDSQSRREIIEIKNGKYDNLDRQDKRIVKRSYEYDESDTLYAITDFDEQGGMVRLQALNSDGSLRSETIHKFNANNDIVEIIDGLSDAHELHHYDEKGRLVRSEIRWGKDEWVELYSYSDDTERIKTTVNGKDTIVTGVKETLDEKGRLINRQAEYKYGIGKYTETWAYDQFGNEIDYKEVNDKGELQEYFRAEYNRFGLLIHEASGVGTSESSQSWYDYDELGRQIANKEIRSGALVSKSRTVYKDNEERSFYQLLSGGSEEEVYSGKTVYEYYE